MHNLVPRDSLLSQLPKSTDTPLSGFCAKFGIRDTCPWFKNKCQTKQKKMNFRRLPTKQSDVTVWQDAHFLLSLQVADVQILLNLIRFLKGTCLHSEINFHLRLQQTHSEMDGMGFAETTSLRKLLISCTISLCLSSF